MRKLPVFVERPHRRRRRLALPTLSTVGGTARAARRLVADRPTRMVIRRIQAAAADGASEPLHDHRIDLLPEAAYLAWHDRNARPLYGSLGGTARAPSPHLAR